MLKEKTTFPLITLDKKRMDLQVNWNSQKGVANGESIKFIWDGKEAVIATGDLFFILLSIVKKKEASQLIRQFSKTSQVKYEPRMVSFTATKDIKKGEKVSTMLQVPVETIDYTK